MNKDEILKKYHQEKDEGMIYIKNKALLRGYSFMIMIAIFFMIMSILLNGERIIFEIIYFLIMPFLFFLYGFRGFCLKQKLYIFISAIWFLMFCLRFYDIITMLFH